MLAASGFALELLETACLVYQSGLVDRLEYELTFNDYSRVIIAKDDPGASYFVADICLEHDFATHPELPILSEASMQAVWESNMIGFIGTETSPLTNPARGRILTSTYPPEALKEFSYRLNHLSGTLLPSRAKPWHLPIPR